MRLLLDSSYLLFYFQVTIEGIPFDFLKQLQARSDLELVISEISYSELVAKCFKLSLIDGRLSSDEILSGLDSVRHNSHLEVLSWYEHPKLLETAYQLRKIHLDFFDCIIFASALLMADAIGTFDDILYTKINHSNEIRTMVQTRNPEFEFWFFDFKNKPKKLIA
jgi:predicted nucleic acid-binding protein